MQPGISRVEPGPGSHPLPQSHGAQGPAPVLPAPAHSSPMPWGAGAGPCGTHPPPPPANAALCSPVTMLSHLLINQADCNVFLGH